MCDKAVKKMSYKLKFVLDQYKTQEVCERSIELLPWFLCYFLINTRSERCVKKLLSEHRV